MKHPSYGLSPYPLAMTYRVCKAFEIESGHMLSKHPGRCRYPHGHSRRIEVVVERDTLDKNDMVCDFKALKLALEADLDALDHALLVNADDPVVDALPADLSKRLICYKNEDPTTEVLARRIYESLKAHITEQKPLVDAHGQRYHLPADLHIARVRVSETTSSWAEYGP